MTARTRPSKSFASGFTLVELLVVIVIIAVLAGVGFAGVRKMLDHAHRSKVVSDLRQLASYGQLFSAENHANRC